EGALAGSAIGLVDAVRYCHDVVGLALDECLRMASRYPARVVGDKTRGHLQPGARADMVLLGTTLEVAATWLGGVRQDHATLR
ncbi:MAG TPA: N-acetylglucosamine-6-phosphate deacetylase, partial [Halieaceae bacterium]|nr:N-acetylglucosamine-6-phosphate deacetylase [Halieaceae bacterium]